MNDCHVSITFALFVVSMVRWLGQTYPLVHSKSNSNQRAPPKPKPKRPTKSNAPPTSQNPSPKAPPNGPPPPPPRPKPRSTEAPKPSNGAMSTRQMPKDPSASCPLRCICCTSDAKSCSACRQERGPRKFGGPRVFPSNQGLQVPGWGGGGDQVAFLRKLVSVKRRRCHFGGRGGDQPSMGRTPCPKTKRFRGVEGK